VNATYLRWTAPADRGVAVTAYELRRSLSPITEANFGSASQVSTGTPNYPGYTERVTATGLSSNTCYYFALKSYSSCDTVSAISNVYWHMHLEPGWALSGLRRPPRPPRCDRWRPVAAVSTPAEPGTRGADLA